jgi:uncharacterized protein
MDSCHPLVAVLIALDKEAPMAEVTADAAGSDSQLLEAENVQAASGAALAGDPVVLGLLVFALGSTVLGISLLGYVPAAIQGASIMPIVFAATGLGLLVTTVWAAALGQTFVATVLGAFACFWISYAALVLGLTHNWYAIPATDITHTVVQFLIGWLVVIFMLDVVSFRVPLAFTLILSCGFVGVLFVTLGVANASTGMTKTGGVFILLLAALGYYAYLSTATASVGGKPLPLGSPLLSMFGSR